MIDLTSKHCKPCEKGTPPLPLEKIKEALSQFSEGWEISTDGKAIHRTFIFKNYYQTMSFVNAIAFIANRENHHPDLEVGYDHCRVQFTTHSIDGISENDLISIAKVDQLLR